MGDENGSACQFWKRLLAELMANCYAFVPDNVDRLRYPRKQTLFRTLKDWGLQHLSSLGLYRPPWDHVNRLNAILAAGPLERVFDLLADEESRLWLVRLAAFRILDSQHYKLPLNGPEYRDTQRRIQGCLEEAGVVPDVESGGRLDIYRIDGIRLISRPVQLFSTFGVEQYRCRRAGIGVRAGDVVIDGGACWGDTSLYFARHASRVLACECMESNVLIFNRNMSMNPELAARVTLVRGALWDQPDQALAFSDRGTSSRMGQPGGGVAVTSTTIDEIVRGQNLDRVDFIKMDIEGAEAAALRGAVETIRRFRPRLAICVYHCVEDMARIPLWVAGLDLGYRLYLDHFTMHAEESVLFAEAGG